MEQANKLAVQQTQAIQPAQQQSKLLEIMAAQYKLDGAAFKNVLLKTVFPQDKPVTIEQLASFCAVAHEYKLNPLIREIFAFPGKSGGIIPIVSIDGWITMVQRHPQYNGHSFVHEWKDGIAGGQLISMTCLMRRKDREFPIENTEFMDECKRDTDPWKKWPSRMLRHKCFIQSSRYAFGLSGIYDEDEAERILEGELKVNEGGGFRSEIQMPKRQEQITAAAGIQTISTPNTTHTVISGDPVTVTSTVIVPEDPQDFDTDEPEDDGQPKDYGFGASPAAAEETQTTAVDVPTGDDLFDAKPEEAKPASATGKATIGAGRAKRIRAIAFSKKTRTEEDYKELMATFKITNLADYPMDRHKELEDWAEGK